VAVIGETALDQGDLARLLDVDLGRAVDHDLCDVRVSQERLDGAVSEDVVSDLLRDASPVRRGQRDITGCHDLLQGLAHLLLELGLGQSGIIELRPQGVEERLVDLSLQIGEGVDRGGPTRLAGGATTSGARRG